jgi:two-component system, NarL family, response regulator LiaR
MLHTVTIIEDDNTFANLIKGIIDQSPELACVGVYRNAESAKTNFPETPSDVIIMDIQLHEESGIELTAYFKQRYPEVYIIMCTTFDNNESIFGSLKAGANGYIVKMDNPENIVHSIQEVLHGGAPMSMGIAKKVIQFFNKPDEEKARLENLSPKENIVLEQLAKGAYYKEIAELLQVEVDTIKKHCSSIYRKLQVSNRQEASNVLMGR